MPETVEFLTIEQARAELYPPSLLPAVRTVREHLMAAGCARRLGRIVVTTRYAPNLVGNRKMGTAIRMCWPLEFCSGCHGCRGM